MPAEFMLAVFSAIWLGILTSISPCPLATNVAAISFVSRRVDNPGKVLLHGLLYIFGRTLTYAVLGVLLVSSLLSAPALSHVLQKYMHLVLGPILILVGMVLLDLLSFPLPSFGGGRKMQDRIDALGAWGAVLLGILFALSFCPVSAALFFGSLLPLAVQHKSGIVLPVLYGIATGLPVALFSLIIAFGLQRLAEAYKALTGFEKWARRLTGVLFIGIGLYYSVTMIFGVGI
ncbi:MAG: sulfite exporter TauE/SafE family protein [Deltaproteobacteria bacterium]|nr:sulfite exporter TauE/SafE family protein [Deltaproteobacteria bacterium]TLN01903.1 MAG: sulfite exporter TauE/SafE family protein [bacterium]